MSGRFRVAFAARCGRLRQFAIGILLLAISSLVLQGVAHASPTGHALHREQSAATASHCAQHHMSGDHGAATSAGCESDGGGQMLATCTVSAEGGDGDLKISSRADGQVFAGGFITLEEGLIG